MELGNILFGHTSENTMVPIDRDKFQELFLNLVECYQMCDENDNIISIENDVFELRPYYWGDCTCDGEQADRDWCDKNDHKYDCYKRTIQKMQDEKEDFLTLEDVKPILKQYNLPEQGWGTHCTCDYEKRWQEFLQNRGGYHRKECECEKPNFWYKPTNLIINWYKYPLRDAYSNREFTKDELKVIFRKCGESMKNGNNI